MTYRDDILRLRQEGLSYKEISERLGCSKGTISYHLGEGQKEKTAERTRAWRESNQGQRRLYDFKDRCPGPGDKNVRDGGARHASCDRVKKFQQRTERHGEYDTKVERFITFDELREMHPTPVCYLTGRELDWDDLSTWSLDHMIPISKGGDSTLENMGITHPAANRAKSNLDLEEFLTLCEDVLRYHDRI